MNVTTLPPTITSAEYGVYGLQAVAVVVTFCVGIALQGHDNPSILVHDRRGIGKPRTSRCDQSRHQDTQEKAT